MAKKVFFMGMTALALAFEVVLAGCASWPEEGPSGMLTITGIPAEYEGKFVKSSSYVPPADTAKLFATPKEVARAPVSVIRNGEAKLPLYGKKAGYFDSDIADTGLRIRDTAEALAGQIGNAGFDIMFALVRFNNGVADLKWNDQVTPGIVIITGIPAEFPDAGATGATVYIGHPDYKLKVSVFMNAPVSTGAEATCFVEFEKGIGRFFVSEYGKYGHFPQSGTRDVIVQLGKTDPDNPTTLSYSFFHFKSAPIQDGTITLDLSKGDKR
jgi:hypothetical protein